MLNFRIKQLSDHFCKNPNQFAKKLNVTSETIRKIYIGDTKDVKSSLLSKILEVFPEVDPEWLLTGQGNMLKLPEIPGHEKTRVEESRQPYIAFTPQEQVPVVTQDTSENTTIPLVDIKAAASYNTGYMSEGYIEELPPFSFPHHLINGGKQYYAFQVMGDSMHPTLYNNDYVVASYIEPNDWLDIKDEYIYVIVTESRGINIKRLKNRIREHGFIRARSDNRSHPAFNIEINDILQIWQVRCKISFNLPNENESLYNIVMELKDDVESLKDKLD